MVTTIAIQSTKSIEVAVRMDWIPIELNSMVGNSVAE
jgi:hypothetical protein